MTRNRHFRFLVLILLGLFLRSGAQVEAGELRAGTARVDITDRAAGPVHDPCYAKALVLKSDDAVAVLITVDAVAIGEIGRIRNDFLKNVRAKLQADLGIAPESVVINASHCHGVVRADTEQLTVAAVKAAFAKLAPVAVGAGVGTEDRISENRRLKMKDGSEVDMRRAYSLPRGEDVAAVGPIDPQIGLLRIDRLDGKPLAVVYQFACHPIMNPPSRGNSADFPAAASQVIEESLGHGALAFFLQGCGGDINPVRYKETSRPADAEPLGNLLGLSAMRAVREIKPQPNAKLKVSSETIAVPRGADLATRITAIEAEQKRLLAALKPTNINFQTFVPLLIAERLSPEFPSHHAQSYLHDRALGRTDIDKLDAANRAGVEAYLQNIQVMEQLTRLNTNLALLKKHLAQNQAAASDTIDVEVGGLRIGDFKLVTFPGELTVEVGLGIKQRAGDRHAFVSGYTNGYIYYAPTTEQRRNTGYAQEDCDSIVAPEWQRVFELKALDVLKRLGE
jgi:hypothetical protein